MVTITPDAVGRSVAAANAAMVLALSTALFAKDRSVRRGNWQSGYALIGAGLSGKRLGSIGFGNIAKETFRLMKGFDMHYWAYSPRADAAEAGKYGVRLADLDMVLKESDYLLVNCPLNASTFRMIGAAQLALMKCSAYDIFRALPEGRIPPHVVNREVLDSAKLMEKMAALGRGAGANGRLR